MSEFHQVQCECGRVLSVAYALVRLPDLVRAQRSVAELFDQLRALPETERRTWLAARLGRPVASERLLAGMQSDLFRHTLTPHATGSEYACPDCGRTGNAPLSPIFGQLSSAIPVAACPFCGHKLRTAQAKQCLACHADWHNGDPGAG